MRLSQCTLTPYLTSEVFILLFHVFCCVITASVRLIEDDIDNIGISEGGAAEPVFVSSSPFFNVQ